MLQRLPKKRGPIIMKMRLTTQVSKLQQDKKSQVSRDTNLLRKVKNEQSIKYLKNVKDAKMVNATSKTLLLISSQKF